MSDQGLIIVGVDGSESARAALEFALGEATRRPARLAVVIAYLPPQALPIAYGLPSGVILPPSVQELHEAAERTVREVVDDVTARLPTVTPEIRVVSGHPAHVLVREA